jgi:diguanylate cyclase (GGDEF)-like protein
MIRELIRRFLEVDLATASGRAIAEERYASLRRQVPIVYLLGFVNLAGMEMATVGRLAPGFNLPTFIALCGLVRLSQWYGASRKPKQDEMVRRMAQTVLFAAIVCIAVCVRCVHLLMTGDTASHMAVMLFGGLTAIGVSYGLTALPAASRIPLVLIILPVSATAALSGDAQFAWAGFGLVVVSALTMRLLSMHNLHLTDLIRSRSTIEHQQILAECAHQEAVVAATTDFLTGLPNRRAFVAAIESAIASKEGNAFALGLLDLNRFKAINDTFGHDAGDQLLQRVAERLLAEAGGSGIVARLGGDEFGILLPGVPSARDARTAGSRILNVVNRPVTINNREFEVSASCGLALSQDTDQPSPSRIMADADLALYQAKDSASAHLAIFERRMEAPRRRRLQIERALRVPGIENALHLVFQPIVDLNSRRIIAHEALARWTDPELGPVAPSEFMPIAEQLNLIDGINSHLMALAFEQARAWPTEIKLSFNLSALQLCSSGFAAKVLDELGKAGIETARLQVEVTETALLADFERARHNLTTLSKAGVTIVLDDFGAGYASIGYLRELRFDQIKLDGALVTAAQDSTDGRRLLGAVIGLCEMLGVSSVAEHIESEELLNLVMRLGCRAGQGFWLHRPVAAQSLHGLDCLLSRPAVSLRDLADRRAA